MAIVTEMPADTPVSSDTIAAIVDPDAIDPAEIRAFGKTLLTVADPPEPGDTIVLLMRLRVYDVGTEFNDNGEGEGTPYRKMKLVSCWVPGTTEPVKPKPKTQAEKDAEAEAAAAENQPALYDDLDPEADAHTDAAEDQTVDPADYSPFSGDNT